MPGWDDLSPYYGDSYIAYKQSILPGSREYAQVLDAARSAGQYRHTPFSAVASLLDFGCGGGDFLAVMRDLGVASVGVDPSPIAVERSRERGLTVMQGGSSDVADLFGDRRFDIITLSHVLEHVHNPIDCLAGLARVLRGDGIMVIAVPNSSYWACRLLRRHWHSTDVPRHIQQFTVNSMREVATRAGLYPDRIFTFSLPKGVKSSIRQALRRVLFVPGAVSARIRLIDYVAERFVGPWLDKRCQGEGIVAWLRPKSA